MSRATAAVQGQGEGDPIRLDGDNLSTEEASEFLGGVPIKTLEFWRHARKGPPYVKLGRHVRYPRSGLVQFMRENLRAS